MLALSFIRFPDAAGAADAPALIPLESYSRTSGIEKDPVALSYIASRCSALYVLLSKTLEDEIDPARQKVRKEFDATAEYFMGKAANFELNGSKRGAEAALKQVGNRIVEMAKIYSEVIERAKIRTNNMFDDPLIAGDWNFCKRLMQLLK